MGEQLHNMSLREFVQKRLGDLKNEGQSWHATWRECADAYLPVVPTSLLGSYMVPTSPQAVGSRRNKRMINSRPRRAVRILAAGMQAGLSSPARPWFKLTTPDQALNESAAVKNFLRICEERIRAVFLASNFYNASHRLYEGLAVFGTHATLIDEDVEDQMRCHTLPQGWYAMAASARGSVDTVYRASPLTVVNVVNKFGLDACSRRTREAYERGNYSNPVTIFHAVDPNLEREAGRADARGKAWRSLWWEDGSEETDGFLRVSGYEEFPLLAPRWAGDEVYGTGPGLDALGDSNALQVLEKHKGRQIARLGDPPMAGSASLRGRGSTLPGELTILPGPNDRFEPAVKTDPTGVTVTANEIREHEARIDADFYADLWLAVLNDERSNITAREINERHEEKMIQLGPVLDRLSDEVFDPVIDRVFAMLLRNGQLPPPPRELQGVALSVEFVSTMAQAQKLLGISSVERAASFAGSLSATNAAILDRFDGDRALKVYCDMLGTDPEILRTDEKVEQIRAQRAEAEKAKQQGEAAMQMAQGAKTLSEADMQGDSALNRLLSNLGGMPAGLAAGGAA